METHRSDREIAEIIVLELVCESSFHDNINHNFKWRFEKETNYFRNYKEFMHFTKNIIIKQRGYTTHTYPLQLQAKDIQALVTIGIIEHYWEQHRTDTFNRSNIPEEVRYLFEEQTPKTQWSTKQRHGAWKAKYDDQAEANRYTMDSLLNINNPLKFLKPEGEITMNKIETVVRINSSDASEYDDDAIFALIAKTEGDIAKLEAIKEKPKKLEAKIESMRDSIKELVKIVDERD